MLGRFLSISLCFLDLGYMFDYLECLFEIVCIFRYLLIFVYQVQFHIPISPPKLIFPSLAVWLAAGWGRRWLLLAANTPVKIPA